jgi:serine/threonine protein kinase/tetratricopeptide (TPR) repeat protein
MIGQTISHFQILQKLGEGGMGVVYKAEDTKLRRTVALKFLPAELTRDREAKERFVHEAQAASALQHNNICTIHDIDETTDGRLFIVMDCYEGESVRSRIAKGPLQIEAATDIALQIAQGLSQAHKKGIVHRDIKPGNVIMTDDGVAKILDFGLAKLAGQSRVTKIGSTVGTAPYMSPEQARGEELDFRTDIWSLGAVLYEMTTGQVPFTGDYSEAVFYQILNEAPKLPTSLRGDLPPELERIIRKCLEKERERRYQHLDELVVDLSRLKGASVGFPLTWRMAQRRLWSSWIARSVFATLIVLAGVVVAQRLLTSADNVIDSIAVLPFENLSGNADQAYLADGIEETLITDLTKLSGFRRVIARSSVKRFANTMLPPREIAEQLGVRALLTGTVLRFGGEIQVTAHLIDAPTENAIWSERYTRKAGDVFPLINEIVATLAHQIQLHLTSAEQERLQSPRKVAGDAFEAYLQGNFHWAKQTKEDLDKAERYFQLALERDSTFALAYGGLALVWAIRGDAGFLPPGETFPKARALIDKALAMDSTLAELHVDLANIKGATEWDWAGAILEFNRALAMNPNLSDAHFFYGDLLHYLRRPEGWEREMKRGLELDPLNDFKRTYYGWNLNYAGRYDEAIPMFLKLLETGPNKSANYLGLWGSYYKKGMYGQALQAAKNYFLTCGGTEFAESLTMDSAAGATEYRAAMLRTGELMAQRSAQRHVPAIRIARMYAHAGDNDHAMDWLERAYQARESPLMRLAVFWDWDNLRSDARFQDLLRRMNLPSGKD